MTSDEQEMFDISLVFEFPQKNEVILDYIEMIWCCYFAIIFALLATKLERASAFIYNMRIFGFYEVWMMMRANPVYISSPIVDSLFRCVAASMITATVQRFCQADTIIQGWTVVTIVTGYTIICFDPMLREYAGCSDEAGPPTADFPHGVWMNCDDWRFAYFASWLYAGVKYMMLGIVSGCVYCVSNSDIFNCITAALSAASIATSALTTATRAFVRRDNFWLYDEFTNVFLDVCFYFYFGFIVLLQYCIYKCFRDSTTYKCCFVFGWYVFRFVAAPMYIVEWILMKIEDSFQDKNEDDFGL